MAAFPLKHSGFRTIAVFVAIIWPLSSVSFGQTESSDSTQNLSASTAHKTMRRLENYGSGLFSRAYLTGDWGGARSGLARKGVSFRLDFTNVLQSVLHGGAERGTEFGMSVDFWAKVDLERMELIPGGSLTFRVEGDVGNSIITQAGTIMAPNYNALFPIANELNDNDLTVTNLYYTQFFGEHFGVFLGRFDTFHDGNLAEFAGLGPDAGKTQFLNVALNSIPVMPITEPYVTALGFGVIVRPSEYTVLSAMVIDSRESSQKVGLDGFGSEWNGFLGLRRQYRLFDLPGGWTLGFSYSWNGDYTNLEGGQHTNTVSGMPSAFADTTWAVIYNVWQYFQVFGADTKGPIDLLNGRPDRRGWGAFVIGGFGDRKTDPVQWSLALGLGGRGIFSSRPNDIFGIGYFYMDLEGAVAANLSNVTKNEQGLELFYNVEVFPWFQVTPDLQIVEPGISGNSTAVIAALRGMLRF